MTNVSLAQSYLIKATKRLKILPVLLESGPPQEITPFQGIMPDLSGNFPENRGVPRKPPL
jgi:hypothetical protein